MPRGWRSVARWSGWLLLALWVSGWAAPALLDAQTPQRPVLSIPRLNRAPELEDFLEMQPNDLMAGRLAKIEGFIQRDPSDGAPSTQRTVAYLGYDDRNLYFIFVCFDSEPGKVRARMVRREDTAGDDAVGFLLDTFNDQRRAYVFISNPFGIQYDALANEGQEVDATFDTVWHSRGKLTPQGYVVWIAIPFKSLRFSPDPAQTWGILLARTIPRVNENTYWPHYSARIEGRMNQAALLQGLRDISPGRNFQFIPYGLFRSFRAPDFRDPAQPRFVRDRADPDVGVDAKFVFKDQLVLDVAVNPDFSQVESDEPQVTVNQRFEVFFPEKRPFFLENANYFATPINLLFTRRVLDPQFGVRLTGKVGSYALGGFLIDDEGPGRSVPPGDPLFGKRALFGIVRVNRDIFRQSTLGMIFTAREFEGSSNRVGGVDSRLKFGQNWVANLQAVASSTQQLGGTRLGGPAYDAELRRSGRKLNYQLEYNDRSPGFRTEPGFLLRPDIRRLGQTLSYRFRPEGRWLISWGPDFFYSHVWDHSGLRLDWVSDTAVYAELTGQTLVGVGYNNQRERLRPQDFPVLSAPQDFNRKHFGVLAQTSYFRQVSVTAVGRWGQRINFFPQAGQPPVLADWNDLTFQLTLRPLTQLRIDNTYLLTRLRDRASGTAILNDHILRSKINWQFTRELSLRVILQYNATVTNCTLAGPPVPPNCALTSLPTAKNFNADVLVTYLLNPWTALYVGYNSNLQNFDPALAQVNPPSDLSLVRPRNDFINDAKQFFVKFSYLLRF